MRPARSPLCSRTVSQSARIWHGWKSSVRALITGTPACGGHLLEIGLVERAPGDGRRHPAEHAGGVGHGLATADLGGAGVEDQRHAAEVGDADRERDPRAGGRLVEQDGHRLRPLERPAPVRVGLHLGGERQHLGLLVRGEVVVAQEVPHDALPLGLVEQHAQRLDRAVGLLGGEDERRGEAQPVGRGVVDDQAGVERGLLDVGGDRAGEHDADEQAATGGVRRPAGGRTGRRGCGRRRSRAFSSRPSSSIVVMTASAAAVATGLPPNVVPWLPGCRSVPASPRAMQAPIGMPPPSPLATVTRSGVDAGRQVGEPLARAADAGLHLVDPEQRAVLGGDPAGRGQVVVGRAR